MTVSVSDAWKVHGLQALLVENRELRVVVLPELGGKIWSIVSKRHDREMLWHHPRMTPRPAHYDAAYDNWFCGGWDEVFPNDYPVTIDGEPYPDHGEVWSMPASWSVSRQDGAASIALEHRGIAIDTRFRKVITLREGERDLHVRYEIANAGRAPLEVHWKTHPALPLEAGARLHLPARRVLVDEGFAGAFGADEFAWPHAPLPDGGERDLRTLPDPGAGDMWFFYGLELAAGYCAVSYPASSVGFGLTFDPAAMSSVWVFASFGAWRNLNTIILEPCTGYPARLDEAIAHGSATSLAPGAPFATEMLMSVLGDAADIAAFERAGGRSDLMGR